MRAQEFITESFNDPYPFKWDVRWAPEEVSTRGTARVGDFKIAFQKWQGDAVAIEFKVDDTFALTGRGDQWRIFATVMASIRAYLKKFGRPRYFVFSSKEEKRSHLYYQMIERSAAKFGYRHARREEISPLLNFGEYTDPGESVFVLIDTQQVLN